MLSIIQSIDYFVAQLRDLLPTMQFARPLHQWEIPSIQVEHIENSYQSHMHPEYFGIKHLSCSEMPLAFLPERVPEHEFRQELQCNPIWIFRINNILIEIKQEFENNSNF